MKKIFLFLSAMLISLMSFAQTVPTNPELTTVTLIYELTKDDVQDRMGGRRYVTTEDAEFGGIQLIIPGFSADVAEYAEASLAVGDSTYAATATFAADAENNKEVYTAHAVSADTIFDATFTILIPATQEYTLTTVDAVAVPETEDGLTMYALEGEFVVEDALIPYELYAEPTSLTVMGTIGEAFVLGEGAEKVTFEIDEEEFYLKATLADDAGNTYNVEMIGVVEGGGEPIVELVLTDTVDVTLYNLTLEPQGPMATVNAGGEVLSFGLTLLPTENYYGFYFSDSFSNIWYGDAQLQPYGDGQYTPDGLTVAFTSIPDAEGKAILYNFTLIPGDEPVVEDPKLEVIEDNITNLVVNDEELTFSGGPSTQYGLEVFLVLGQDNLDGTFALDLEQSAIALNNNDLTIVSGYLKDVDISAPAATAVIVAQLSESETYEFHLTMSGAPAETVVIVVEDALVEVEEWKDFPEAPTSNYALTMTADWTNEADGVTYPVKVEVLVYDPNVTEQADAISNVVVGENIFSEIWLGGVDGCFLNLTTVGGVITAKGVVTTSNGVALDLTISGKLLTTALDNIQVGNETMKVIRDGQLIIIKNDVEYNIQGAVVK